MTSSTKKGFDLMEWLDERLGLQGAFSDQAINFSAAIQQGRARITRYHFHLHGQLAQRRPLQTSIIGTSRSDCMTFAQK